MLAELSADASELLFKASTWVIPVLLAIPLHEVAHGMVANWQGDPTARLQGRLSLNPLRHIDPFGTVVLPIILFLTTPFLFGWAKPVPVNPRYFANPRRQMIWVALAGPGVNFILALVGVIALNLVPTDAGVMTEWTGMTLINLVIINLVLGVFNLIPIPPLDGSRVLTGVLPLPLARHVMALESKGLLILIGLLFILPFVAGQLGFDFNPLGWVVSQPVSFLAQWLFQTFGP